MNLEGALLVRVVNEQTPVTYQISDQ